MANAKQVTKARRTAKCPSKRKEILPESDLLFQKVLSYYENIYKARLWFKIPNPWLRPLYHGPSISPEHYVFIYGKAKLESQVDDAMYQHNEAKKDKAARMEALIDQTVHP